VDLSPDPKLESLRKLVGWLGKERLRPLGLQADAQGAALPPDHPFFVEALSLGLTGGFTGKLDRGEKRPDDDGRPRKRVRRAVVMAEEAAYWDRGMATSLPGPGLGGAPIALMGTAEQKERLLGIFEDTTTPRWTGFGMSEPDAGSDVAAIKTRATRAGDDWVIDGEKAFISNGARASFVVVWATVDSALGRAGHRAFVVHGDNPGMTVARIDKKMGLAASETAALVFEGCRVSGEDLVGGEAAYERREGFKGAMRTFNMTRPMVAAMAVGIGRAAHDEARRFVDERFGPASQRRRDRALERLAHMRGLLDTARVLAWRAAWLADYHQDNAVAAAIAKAYAAPAALRAASLGMDVLADAGGARDHLIEKLWRDVKALDIVEGTGQIQRLLIARRLVEHGQHEHGQHGHRQQEAAT
jgi:acyl-CoA dehydrogenase